MKKIMGKDLKIKVDKGYFEKNGYIFQKLYASDYPVYHKKIESWTLWCWLDNGEIEINDWYDNTLLITDFYIENRDKMKQSKMFKDYQYIDFLLFLKTKEIVLKDDIIKTFDNRLEFLKSDFNNNQHIQTIVLTPHFDNVVDELKIISTF